MYREYLQKLNLVSMKDDVSYTVGVKQSFYNNMYPFNLFPDKGLQEIEFAPITFFYGGNGSGKTTLLNVLAEKLELTRHSPFNGSSLFQDYVKMCQVQAKPIPENSQILTSDDVFDYLLDTRAVNDGINDRRAELMQEYLDNKIEPGWCNKVNKAKIIVRKGKETMDQINILGDDGVPISYHETFWKSELVDFVILQQDAFDPIDSLCPLDRQRYMLNLVLDICDHEFEFDNYEECRNYFKEIINLLRQMNFSEFEGEQFNKYMAEIKQKLEENGK